MIEGRGPALKTRPVPSPCPPRPGNKRLGAKSPRVIDAGLTAVRGAVRIEAGLGLPIGVSLTPAKEERAK